MEKEVDWILKEIKPLDGFVTFCHGDISFISYSLLVRIDANIEKQNVFTRKVLLIIKELFGYNQKKQHILRLTLIEFL